jgi:hypothetical protein
MRILLIEDFGKREGTIKAYIRDVFGDLLGRDAMPHWKDDDIDLEEEPEELLNFFKQYSPNHDEAVLCRHYFDFKQVNHNILQDFDVILLDINLSEGVNRQAPVPEGYKHEKGGFYIYHELLRHGFPDNKICFLTGEGDTLGNFKHMCHEMSMPKPSHAFEKGDEGFKAIRNWLETQHSDDYLTLRRGIIEGCRYILSQFEQHPAEMIQFAQFLENKQAEDMVNDMRGYLKIVQNFLPIRQPDDKQTLYKLFVRTLSHDWEAAQPDNLPKCFQGNRDCIRARNVNYMFGSILKSTRNWITHTTVLDKLSEQEVAFLYLAAMRAMFILPQETQTYESMLLNLFDKIGKKEMDKKIGSHHRGTNLPLATTYLEVKNAIVGAENTNVEDSVYFNKMLNHMNHNKVKLNEFDYVTKLFQMFWHGLSKMKYVNPAPSVSDAKNVLSFKCEFFFNYYENKEEGFLFELARSIYKRSFEK